MNYWALSEYCQEQDLNKNQDDALVEKAMKFDRHQFNLLLQMDQHSKKGYEHDTSALCNAPSSVLLAVQTLLVRKRRLKTSLSKGTVGLKAHDH